MEVILVLIFTHAGTQLMEMFHLKADQWKLLCIKVLLCKGLTMSNVTMSLNIHLQEKKKKYTNYN